MNNCTILPNEVFQIHLSANALAIYAYLRRLADSDTHQCWPSYANIAGTFGCSTRTVAKYVAELCEAELINIEPTTVTTADGLKWNGNLRYTLLPIRRAVSLFHGRQLAKLDAARVRKKQPRKQTPHAEYVAARLVHEPEELPL